MFPSESAQGRGRVNSATVPGVRWLTERVAGRVNTRKGAYDLCDRPRCEMVDLTCSGPSKCKEKDPRSSRLRVCFLLPLNNTYKETLLHPN